MGHHQVDQYTHYKGSRSKRDKGKESLFKEIMAENYPSLGKETDIQIQKSQKLLKKVNLKRPTLKLTVIKLPEVKDKERILKAAREKQLATYKGIPVRLSEYFSKNLVDQIVE